MKVKYLIFICIFLFSQYILSGQEKLMKIDSLYLTSIDDFYEKADSAKSEIWNEMELAPICLFRVNGPALLYNHPNPPQKFTQVTDKLYVGKQSDLQLYGSTQMEINDILTAIADYGADSYSCIEEVYAVVFHELHHVYQTNFIDQLEFDNPAILLTYPENYANDAIKNYEQKILYNMCFEQDSLKFQSLLNQFYSCRFKRQQIINTYAKYEESVENIEGPAFYCEYSYYNRFCSKNNALKSSYINTHFFDILSSPYYGRNNLRERHLASGMVMCYILDRYFNNWQRDYYSKEISLYSYFMSRFNPQKEELKIDSSFFSLSNFHTQQAIVEHQMSFDKFMDQPGIKINLEFSETPKFEGFDPMNAESINDSIILHSTILKLSNGDENKLFIHYDRAVTLVDKEIWFVRKVILFVSKENIRIENDKLFVDTEKVNIAWTGKLKKKNEKEIIFNCE
ncbi:MAG: hypothetical protein R6T91_06025 [Bacteroidales bacterium]